jgi:hypothetical protein
MQDMKGDFIMNVEVLKKQNKILEMKIKISTSSAQSITNR